MDDLVALLRRPELRDPVLVTAFTGWVDAGYAGATTLGALTDQLVDPEDLATVDLADLADLQANRPTVHLVDGGVRDIEYPAIRMISGRLGRDLVLCTGPEPSLRWPWVAASIADVAVELGVTESYGIGGMPALASHRRPIQVLATAGSHSVAQLAGALRADYAGPTGFQTVLQHELSGRGVRAFGLWAQVPQYVSASAAPTAARALMARLAELARLDVDLRPFDEPGDAWSRRIEEGLAERPDVAQLVDKLDEELASRPESDSGDGAALVDEIERFLRSQRGGD